MRAFDFRHFGKVGKTQCMDICGWRSEKMDRPEEMVEHTVVLGYVRTQNAPSLARLAAGIPSDRSGEKGGVPAIPSRG